MNLEQSLIASSPTSQRTIGAVFATFNRGELARRCAIAMLEDTNLQQLVIIDDGSSDNTIEILQSISDERLMLIPTAHVGRTTARKLGVESLKTDIALVVDDDVIAQSKLATSHLGHHQTTDRLVVVGYMPIEVTPKSNALTRIYAEEYEGAIAKYKGTNTAILDKLWGGNVSYPRDLLLTAINTVDPALEYHEDRALGLACKNIGMTALFDRSAYAIHEHSRSLAGFERDAINRGYALVEERPGIQLSPTQRVAALTPVRQIIKSIAAPIIQRALPGAQVGAKALRRCALAYGMKQAIAHRANQQHNGK